MKKIVLILLCVIPMVIFAQKQCNVTYISNEGFIVEFKNKKILIDALFDKVEGDWCESPTDSMINLIKQSKYPFNDIDLIAITHNHADHFNEKIVVDFMLNNLKVKLICPNQVDLALSTNSNYRAISERITPITPDPLTDTSVIISGITIRLLRLEHSPYEVQDSATGEKVNIHKDVENLGFVFQVEGVKIFHSGDTNPSNKQEYQTYNLQSEGIDIAFVERIFIFIYQDKGLEIIKEFINPDNLIFMHIGPKNKAGYIEGFKNEKDVIIFENRMDSLAIDIED
ncbi:MAG: MBL fold metallo-hydrolase [Bacteroidales bacterium]|nr:MBL fold metallo-hydrolase [Bacteroidales bacterium]